MAEDIADIKDQLKKKSNEIPSGDEEEDFKLPIENTNQLEEFNEFCKNSKNMVILKYFLILKRIYVN